MASLHLESRRLSQRKPATCMFMYTIYFLPQQSPDGVGVHHEPNGLPGKLGGPAEAHGPWGGDSPAGGCHLGGLLRAHLSKAHLTVKLCFQVEMLLCSALLALNFPRFGRRVHVNALFG